MWNRGYYREVFEEIKYGLAVPLLLVAIAGCDALCTKPQPREYADSTPKIEESSIYSMRHNAIHGLYLSVQERTKNPDKMRETTFFDWGFDGNLDRVRIIQTSRKDYVITNQTELAKWQPLFEQMRARRLGKYDSNKHPYD